MECNTLFYQMISDIFNYNSDLISPDMGMVLISDLWICAMSDQHIQDIIDESVFDPGCQFCIGKSTGTAFTKLNVGVFIKDPFLEESVDIFFSFFDAFPFFKYAYFETGFI